MKFGRGCKINTCMVDEWLSVATDMGVKVGGATPLSMACQNGHVINVLLARHEIQITADMFAYSTPVLKMDRICTSICASGQDFVSTTSFYIAFADLAMITHLPTHLMRCIFSFFGCPENKRCTHKMIRAHLYRAAPGAREFEQSWKAPGRALLAHDTG